ncbi:MAG: hypothetical protein GX442_12125 [Candidatus Riflebacteria bacterium]|nr:hypothetical protein [Candidatus Riflebacteria bacterium]
MTFAAILLACLAGCGGGGGGGGGTGIDPVEVEIRAALDTFRASVQTENLAQTKAGLAPSLKYFRAGGAIEPLDTFVTRISGFFDKAASITLTFDDLGVSPSSETSASARCSLKCDYRDAAGLPQHLEETAELDLERVGTWQITALSRFNKEGMTFPP